MRILPLLLAALLLSACSGNTATGPTDARLAGTWAQRAAVSGTSFVLRLDARGSTVTGSGTYTIEGERSGTLTATGTSADGGLRLTIKYDSGEAAQFTGARVSDSELSGSLHLGPAGSLTPAHIVNFDRRD